MQYGLYTSRSSQPRPRLSLSSQKHHGAEPIYINTLVRLWWSTHKLNRLFNRPVPILAWIKRTKSNKKYTVGGQPKSVHPESSYGSHTLQDRVFSYALNGQF